MINPKNVVIKLSIFLFIILLLYLIEGACFRLVDKYAIWRLETAWGTPSKPYQNEILEKFPFDHFHVCPTNHPKPNHLGYWIEDELLYSQKIFSFSRPLQDTYKDFEVYEDNPLDGLKISDYDIINGLVLPNLKKYATSKDVSRGLARREGDEIETAKAIFIKVVDKSETESLDSSFKNLESTFGFLAKHGFACCILPVFSAEDLVDRISRFKNSEPEIASKLFAWGERKAATFLMESVKLNSALWNGLILTRPEEYISPSVNTGLPWVFFEIDEELKFDEQSLSVLYEWIQKSRLAKNIYASRLSGLIKKIDDETVITNMPPVFVSYLIYGLNFITEMSSELETNLKPIKYTENFPTDSKYDKINKLFSDVEEEKADINSFDNLELNDVKPSFDCEMVREYREMYSDNPELLLVSNRDIILKLGLKFEEMGEGVLEQIRLKDPLFYRYYKSLRIIEDSPLN